MSQDAYSKENRDHDPSQLQSATRRGWAALASGVGGDLAQVALDGGVPNVRHVGVSLIVWVYAI